MWKMILLPVVFVTLLLKSNGQNPPAITLLKTEQKAEIIRNLTETLQLNYVYPDTARSMISFIEKQFHLGAYDAVNKPGLLAAALSQDLWSVYHDRHLRVRYDPGLAASIGKGNELSAIDKNRELQLNRQANFGFKKTAILAGNIGYLKLDMFAAVSKDSKLAVHAAFRALQHARALIIDLRENGGGEPEMIQYICNYLFEKRTHLNDIYVRRDNKTGEYWTTPDKQLTSLMKVPVYVLTSKLSFSGAQEFACDLQTRNRGVIVGEVTGGGAHPVEPRAISNGFVLFVPFARAINPITKTNWEGAGVKPDIETPADKALDAALEELRVTSTGE